MPKSYRDVSNAIKYAKGVLTLDIVIDAFEGKGATT